MSNTEPKHRTISPYDLSSSDNPGVLISSPLLNGSNYDEWAINLRMALSSRKKFGFIDGTIPRPTDEDSQLADWTANNHLLVGWTKQTIEPKIRSSISTREIAKELRDIIKKRFSIKSGARIQQLCNSLTTCKQNGSIVDDYFGRLTKIWDGIADWMTTKRCTCGKCSCDLNSAHEQERETLRVHDFLSGLDDAVHGVIGSQLCAISDLDSVYQTITQNETIRSNIIQETLFMSFASQMKPSVPISTRPFNRDPSRQCTACARTGHEASSCFKVVGYPEWYGTSGRGRGRGVVHANSTTIMSANSASQPSPISLTDKDRQGLSNVTDEQWEIIQIMVKGAAKTDTVSSKANEWIIDTGTTHHMTGRTDMMTDVRSIAPVLVNLPTGSNALAYKQGTIHLTSDLALLNVFFVEGFDTNLVSLGQFLSDNFLVAQVTDCLLLLQDRTSKMLIGIGEREGEGLY